MGKRWMASPTLNAFASGASECFDRFVRHRKPASGQPLKELSVAGNCLQRPSPINSK